MGSKLITAILFLLSLSAAVPLFAQSVEGNSRNENSSEGISSDEALANDESWSDQDNGTEAWSDDGWGEAEEAPSQWDWGGFLSLSQGDFVSNNAPKRNPSIKEFRSRGELSRYFEDYFVSLKADFFLDAVTRDTGVDLREASISFSLLGNVDVRLGRQILTWGTGDLVFLNDLFPKDWQSFFSGRDQSYLKAPSNALRGTWYNPVVNVDLVWSPVFDSDIFINGERFGYFNPAVGEVVAAPPKLNVEAPAKSLSNGELALRAFKSIGSKELAFYGYRGFSKQPVGVDVDTGKLFFPRLDVIGASLRAPLGAGIGHAEVAHHSVRDDLSGSNELVANSQNRFLIGYERELLPRFTVAGQYYLERTRHYSQQKLNSLTPEFENGAERHTLTTRLSLRRLKDKLTLSLFGFYSPDDKDRLLIPKINWRYSDRIAAEIGGHLFSGANHHTFLGQFSQNDNAYVRVRYIY